MADKIMRKLYGIGQNYAEIEKDFGEDGTSTG
jgi:hypothetical protein